MAKYQLLSAYINLAGDRNDVAVRGVDNPITYPESLVLQAVHGGQEHVHTLIEVGEVEREPAEEMTRLTLAYGSIAAKVFPSLNGRATLPERDDALPTEAQVAAAQAAAATAMAKAAKPKAAAAKTPAAEPAPSQGTLSLDNLPS